MKKKILCTMMSMVCLLYTSGPKILGDSTGLSAFWVMFSILIGGGLFGFLGMLLGVPVFAMIYYIIRRLVNHSIRKKNLTTVTEAYVEAAGVDAVSYTHLETGWNPCDIPGT